MKMNTRVIRINGMESEDIEDMIIRNSLDWTLVTCGSTVRFGEFNQKDYFMVFQTTNFVAKPFEKYENQ